MSVRGTPEDDLEQIAQLAQLIEEKHREIGIL